MSDYYEHEIAGLKDALAESEAENKKLREAGKYTLEYLEEMERLAGVKYIQSACIYKIKAALGGSE